MASHKVRSFLSFAVLALAITAHAQYVQSTLVSDGVVSANTIDPNLMNPWGLAFSPTGPFWIANNGTATSTVYDSNGMPFPMGSPIVVTIPPAGSNPSGLVFNGGSGFPLTKNGMTAPAVFIFASESGRIEGWNPMLDATHAISRISNGFRGSVYKGATIADDKLFVTDFTNGQVVVYNNMWQNIGHFTDTHVPAGYAPFGIQSIGNGIIVVTFALRHGIDDVSGAGHGIVDLFRVDGTMLRRFATGGVLNSPWGVALAPNNFGPASNTLLIGNFGNGQINMFTVNGLSMGPLMDRSGHVIHPFGLWSIKFGNGGQAGATNTLFYTAGPNGEADGVFGSISMP